MSLHKFIAHVCFIAILFFGFGSIQAESSARIALIIGNSDYTSASRLANPVNDADAMDEALSNIGFEVSKVKNADFTQMRIALREFSAKASQADIALIFFAGHGIEVNKHNYLIPTDAKLATDRDIEFETVPLDLVTQAAGGARQLSLVVLDACRDNPFASSMKRTVATRKIGRGFAKVEPDHGSIVAFAAKEGTVAADGIGKNSPYTKALVKHLNEDGLEIQFMFRKIRDSVLKDTNGEQEPFTYGSLPGKRIFLKPGQGTKTTEPVLQNSDNSQISNLTALSNKNAEITFWDSIKDGTNQAYFNAYLRKYPQGLYSELAKLKIAELKQNELIEKHKKKQELSSSNSFAKSQNAQEHQRNIDHSGFIFPYSHVDLISNYELRSLSKRELRIARNEIFARKGRKFKSPDLQRHFGRFSWYQPYTWNPKLNRVEKTNVRTIQREENSR